MRPGLENDGFRPYAKRYTDEFRRSETFGIVLTLAVFNRYSMGGLILPDLLTNNE
jgi:hypothetical protein